MRPELGALCQFSTDEGPMLGMIQRIWGRNVTLLTCEEGKGRTFVRQATNVQYIEIKHGTRFDTPVETGCMALDAPDRFGNFPALDSESVECGFHVRMIQRVHDRTC